MRETRKETTSPRIMWQTYGNVNENGSKNVMQFPAQPTNPYPALIFVAQVLPLFMRVGVAKLGVGLSQDWIFSEWDDSRCNSKTIGLLVRRHIVAGEFHYVGKEASTRWASEPDLSMMIEAGALDAADETFREYERVVDPKCLQQIRTEAMEFSTKHGSSEHPSVTVQAGSFEQAKADMEFTLGKYIESLLETSRPTTKRQAA